MEELFEMLIKRYPNHQELGRAVSDVYRKLKSREKTTKYIGGHRHEEFNRVDEIIDLTNIIKSVANK
jgi:hypothetical protein